MTNKEIQSKLAEIVTCLNPDEFIYDFLIAYGISKTSITRLKKGDFNLSKEEGEVLYKGKVFFKVERGDRLLSETEHFATEERVARYNPRFIILTDFKTLVAKDTKTGSNKDIALSDLSKHFDFFLPLTGAEVYKASNDNKADRDAAYKLAQLYDILIMDNPSFKEDSHKMNLFLSRLLFCFFAEDTGIFKESIFTEALSLHTEENGSNVNEFLNSLFHKLNLDSGHFPAYLDDFPYVNGGLFRDEIESPVFSSKSRNILLQCGDLDWSEINPDIFGSMIQAVADPEERSDLGMHYTSVPNILKLIRPLFLDELYKEFEKAKGNTRSLLALVKRISKIKFFDPACGSGNFLIITYKELRALEIEIIKELVEQDAKGGKHTMYFTSIRLSQFYGIEIKDFAHEMAVLSLWLAEHQMNQVFESRLEGFGKSKPILPLKEAGNIVCANAALQDWERACPKVQGDEIYIIGNPPYLGARMQDEYQKDDMNLVFGNLKGVNNLDYISIWFYKGMHFIKGITGKCAFVSTNSICQGEQVGLLWPSLLSNGIEIDFAYLSFKWTNNAKGNAGVTVIIVGIRNFSDTPKYIFINNLQKEVKNINGYLLDGANIFIRSRSKPLSNFPEMNFGSMPNDGGYLLLNESEKISLVNKWEILSKNIKRFVGGYEFLNDVSRYCLWIKDVDLESIYLIPEVKERLEAVKNNRENSDREATKKLSGVPFKFGEVRHKDTDSLIVPATTSERREYIPIGALDSDTIISNSAMAVYDAEPWLFGVLHSKMHMVWVNAVGGKLETRYRYSAKLCYNTFPFPDITIKQKETLNQYVFTVLEEREKYPEKTMVWLYNPETMPTALRQAHKELDGAVERIYRLAPFESDAERLEFLFKLYEEMIARGTLFEKQKKSRRSK